MTAYREAILHYLEAERIAGPASRDAAIDYRAQRANVLMMLGEAEGYPASTREAVALFRTLLGEVDPARSGELYGGLLNAMGSALLVLGSQESSRAAFDEALASFVKALPYRAGSASDRAETQFKIGLAHTALGNLFDDREQLALAAAAHRAALDALPPGEHSFIRSMVTGQHALLTIRLGQPDQAPLLLNEAIASIEATPSGSDEPAVNSLILRNQLGIALHELGKRTGDIAYLVSRASGDDLPRRRRRYRSRGRALVPLPLRDQPRSLPAGSCHQDRAGGSPPPRSAGAPGPSRQPRLQLAPQRTAHGRDQARHALSRDRHHGEVSRLSRSVAGGASGSPCRPRFGRTVRLQHQRAGPRQRAS
ncbi:hypothetical protein [Devosia sp. 66-22]|uniref:hypothetical protein n=1 Tax=Devosia sp. 66-22 TaxID=1895753 RepID=UPI0026284E14|nr:hypothetical protein [Devosia sp. 66-22]